MGRCDFLRFRLINDVRKQISMTVCHIKKVRQADQSFESSVLDRCEYLSFYLLPGTP